MWVPGLAEPEIPPQHYDTPVLLLHRHLRVQRQREPLAALLRPLGDRAHECLDPGSDRKAVAAATKLGGRWSQAFDGVVMKSGFLDLPKYLACFVVDLLEAAQVPSDWYH